MAFICYRDKKCEDCELSAFSKSRDAYVCMAKEDVEPEDKKLITSMLLPVLQLTRNLSDLIGLDYEVKGNSEYVTATFSNGSKKVANVTMDSGTSLIRDVLNQIL